MSGLFLAREGRGLPGLRFAVWYTGCTPTSAWWYLACLPGTCVAGPGWWKSLQGQLLRNDDEQLTAGWPAGHAQRAGRASCVAGKLGKPSPCRLPWCRWADLMAAASSSTGCAPPCDVRRHIHTRAHTHTSLVLTLCTPLPHAPHTRALPSVGCCNRLLLTPQATVPTWSPAPTTGW